jgi:uncharacterized protein YceH (UPF0502 family)
MESLEEKSDFDTTGSNNPAAWKPLTRNQRRVVGVLVEKSKTTPDVYPMSLNGVKTGCNQKSNRSPKLDLQEHDVEDTLYELRHLGAVVEVHSGGRVPKFKHQMYDWLGVDKAELAVMAELLLRGEQAVGDLRARAARMENSITGLGELKPILGSLKEKRLLVELTPPGRGQIVTHNLYLADELTKIRSQFGSTGSPEQAVNEPKISQPQTAQHAEPAEHVHEQQGTASSRLEKLEQQFDQLNQSVEGLRQEVAELKRLIES